MGAVKVILQEDVPKLGSAGDLVSVKPGYARNFLVPGGKATVATQGRIKELEHNQRVIADAAHRVNDAPSRLELVDSKKTLFFHSPFCVLFWLGYVFTITECLKYLILN